MALVELDAIAGTGSDPLDRKQLAVGLTEHDERSAPGPVADRRVDEEPVAGEDRRRHRLLDHGHAPRSAEPRSKSGVPRAAAKATEPRRRAGLQIAHAE